MSRTNAEANSEGGGLSYSVDLTPADSKELGLWTRVANNRQLSNRHLSTVVTGLCYSPDILSRRNGIK